MPHLLAARLEALRPPARPCHCFPISGRIAAFDRTLFALHALSIPESPHGDRQATCPVTNSLHPAATNPPFNIKCARAPNAYATGVACCTRAFAQPGCRIMARSGTVLSRMASLSHFDPKTKM